jgi:hypothetical protein
VTKSRAFKALRCQTTITIDMRSNEFLRDCQTEKAAKPRAIFAAISPAAKGCATSKVGIVPQPALCSSREHNQDARGRGEKPGREMSNPVSPPKAVQATTEDLFEAAAHIKSSHTSELVIALCGPIGSPLREVAQSFQEARRRDAALPTSKHRDGLAPVPDDRAAGRRRGLKAHEYSTRVTNA